MLQTGKLAGRFFSWWVLDSKPDGYWIVEFHYILAKRKHNFSRSFQESASEVCQRRLPRRNRGRTRSFELRVNLGLVYRKRKFVGRSDIEGDQNETFVRETLIRYGWGEHIINGMRICEEVDWEKVISRQPTWSRGKTPDTQPPVWNFLGRPERLPCKRLFQVVL